MHQGCFRCLQMRSRLSDLRTGQPEAAPKAPKLDIIVFPLAMGGFSSSKLYRSLKLVEPQTQSSDETGPLTANSEQNI